MMRASDLQNRAFDRKSSFPARFDSLSHAPRSASPSPAPATANVPADSFTPAAPSLAAPAALATAASQQVYTVQPGDTLWGISQKFGTTVARLRELNPAIRNTDFIYPGQQLVVSESGGTTPPPPPSGGTQDYVVKAGDTLGGIAQRFNTTVANLQQLNPWITNPNQINVGWTIKVPGNGGTTPGGGTTPTGPLTNEPNHQFSLNETWPFIKKYANQYGFDPHVLAGMIQQESTFKNYLVHRDGTGHGLLGLDDNGLLGDFEQWVRQTKPGQESYSVGRGSAAQSIDPEWQIEYAAKKLSELSRAYGGDLAATRVWHRGPTYYNDAQGWNYQNLITGHMSRLFANGDPPDQLPPPTPTGTGIFTTKSDANKVFLNQWGPTAYNDKGAIYGYNDCGPTSGAMALQAVGLMPLAGAAGASNAIDKVRDAVVGYDSTQSQLMNMSQLQTGLQRLGANATMLGGDPVAAIDASLSRGHPAVIGGYGVWNAWGSSQRAQNDYLNPWDPKGHFVTVLGKANDGQYIVGDPLVPSGTISVSADQLRTFYAGGFGVLEVSNPNPPPPPPPPSGNKVSFQAANGNYMVAEGGGGSTVNANRAVAGPWEMFDIVDLNGGGLESGDAINIKTQNGLYMVAENGGGGAVNANRTAAAQWEQFRIVEIGGDGHIQDGDRVALQTWDGQHWVCAESGGGREAVANRTAPGAWETFVYHKQ